MIAWGMMRWIDCAYGFRLLRYFANPSSSLQILFSLLSVTLHRIFVSSKSMATTENQSSDSNAPIGAIGNGESNTGASAKGEPGITRSIPSSLLPRIQAT